MANLEDRKDAFENKYALDQETMFKVEARACKLFGLWMAGQMGLEGPDADTYAKEIVSANLEEPGFDDVKRKVIPDITAKQLDISEHTLDTQLNKFMIEAKDQILAGE